MVAVVNGGKHGVSTKCDGPAESDCWTTYDVEPSVDDWLVWAKGKVNPLMWNFVNQNRDHLEHKDSSSQTRSPIRRSIVRLDKVLTRAGLHDNIKSKLDLAMNVAMIRYIGAAAAFREFAINYEHGLRRGHCRQWSVGGYWSGVSTSILLCPPRFLTVGCWIPSCHKIS